MKRLGWLAILAFWAPMAAHGQGVPLQGGAGAPGHAPMYVGAPNSSIVVLGDSGPAGGGGIGTGLSELGVIARGTGTPPYIGQGTGPSGTNICDYDAPITNATGYHFLCFSANAAGGGLITYGAAGGASTLPLNFNVNGVISQIGGSSITIGGTIVGGTPNGLLYDNAGTLGNLATANNGILVTSSGGVPSISSSLPAAVQSGITALGTIATGVWNGSAVGVPYGGTGVATFTANLPLIGNGASAIAQGSISGNTTEFATATGTLTNGHCVSIDSHGNFIDAGGACTTGGGGGTVSSATANQLAYYSSIGTVVVGLTSANNGVLVTSSGGVPSIGTTLPAAVQGNITALGTIATGVWNGTVVTPTYGGTGLATLTAHAVMLGEGTSNVAFAPIGTSGRIMVDKGAATDPGFAAIGGDCTAAFSTTINLTCTETNGVAFATSATTDTTNAANITSGVLASARGGAGTINGILKANGSGVTSLAVKGTDYVSPGSTTQQLGANPTATGASGGVMMGLGGACSFTPTVTGRVQVSFNFTHTNTGIVTDTAQIKYGTGSAPANNAGQTGSNLGSTRAMYEPAGTASMPISMSGYIVTGLTVSTAYWFDIFLAAGGGLAAVALVDCSMVEF